MARTDYQKLRVYQLSEQLGDEVWALVRGWDGFAKRTVGAQLVRAAESVGANIAEGVGRGSYKDNRRFVKIARGSVYETKHWLRRAHRRELLTSAQTDQLKPILDELSPKLNAYLNSIGPKQNDERRTTNSGQ